MPEWGVRLRSGATRSTRGGGNGGAGACLFAFDLLRLNSKDLRPLPLEDRRAHLQKALSGAGKALRFSEHLEADGDAIFRHACALGREGIVSKR